MTTITASAPSTVEAPSVTDAEMPSLTTFGLSDLIRSAEGRQSVGWTDEQGGTCALYGALNLIWGTDLA